MQAPLHFAINRICASHGPLPDFMAMAARLGVRAVELRNDLPAVELRDGMAPAAVAACAADHGIVIRSINALQRFDQPADRLDEARRLAAFAAGCGAQALVLCPTNSRQDRRSAQARHDDLVRALQQLQPVLSDDGLLGLIEPLGFAECALRHKQQALRAIAELGDPPCYALVHDTFHHHVAGDTECFAARTGLVHLSGVEDQTLATSAMRDPQRVLVGPQDRLGTLAQLRQLLQDGYAGYVSFEPFAAAITHAPDVEQRLRESMAYLSAAVAASTGAEVSSVR